MNLRPFKTLSRLSAGLTVTAACAISVTAYAAGQALKSAHSELLSDETFSFDYVVPDVPELREIKPRERNSGGFLSDLFGGLANLMVWVFYAGVAAIAAMILFYIAKEAIRIQQNKRPKAAKKKADPPAPAYTPDATAARTLLGDIDALAAAGKYDEAVHTLLLRSIEDMKANNPRAVPRDLTGREISGLAILSDTARTAFTSICGRVERSLFGGRPLNLADFEHCREAYQGFAFETNPKRRRR